MSDYYQPRTVAVSSLNVDSRATFITRTYCHLLVAIALFIGIEVFLFTCGYAQPMAQVMMSSGLSWMLVLGGFVLVGFLGRKVAYGAQSMSAQYLALAGYVVAESIVFVPLLYIANAYAPGVIQSAALVSLLGFSGLSAVVFLTRKDFSFLRGLVMWGGIIAAVTILVSLCFHLVLGTFFSIAMIALAGGAILYTTSNILHYYPEDRYVAASLELFASVALLFWYVLRLFLGSRR